MVRKTQKTAKTKTSPEIDHLASRIRELRIKKGYKSSEAFALDHQLSRTHYGRWERGSNITYMNLLKLTAAFGVSLEEFFSEGFD
jgi:transcriptional regulator with XRE-family HTH domain